MLYNYIIFPYLISTVLPITSGPRVTQDTTHHTLLLPSLNISSKSGVENHSSTLYGSDNISFNNRTPWTTLVIVANHWKWIPNGIIVMTKLMQIKDHYLVACFWLPIKKLFKSNIKHHTITGVHCKDLWFFKVRIPQNE